MADQTPGQRAAVKETIMTPGQIGNVYFSTEPGRAEGLAGDIRMAIVADRAWREANLVAENKALKGELERVRGLVKEYWRLTGYITQSDRSDGVYAARDAIDPIEAQLRAFAGGEGVKP